MTVDPNIIYFASFIGAFSGVIATIPVLFYLILKMKEKLKQEISLGGFLEDL